MFITYQHGQPRPSCKMTFLTVLFFIFVFASVCLGSAVVEGERVQTLQSILAYIQENILRPLFASLSTVCLSLGSVRGALDYINGVQEGFSQGRYGAKELILAGIVFLALWGLVSTILWTLKLAFVLFAVTVIAFYFYQVKLVA